MRKTKAKELQNENKTRYRIVIWRVYLSASTISI